MRISVPERSMSPAQVLRALAAPVYLVSGVSAGTGMADEDRNRRNGADGDARALMAIYCQHKISTR